MSINDSIQATLPYLQSEAESRMLSTATVRRPSGKSHVDGVTTTEWMVVHEGKLRLAGSERGVSSYRTASIAGVEVQVANRAAHFPIAARSAGFQDGDLIEVTAGENAGTVWRVVEADSADQKTALRLPVIAADRPVEWG